MHGGLMLDGRCSMTSLFDSRFSMALRSDARWPDARWPLLNGRCSMAAARWPLFDGRFMMVSRDGYFLMSLEFYYPASRHEKM